MGFQGTHQVFRSSSGPGGPCPGLQLLLPERRCLPNQTIAYQSAQQQHERPGRAWLREHWGPASAWVSPDPPLAHLFLQVCDRCFSPTRLKCQLLWDQTPPVPVWTDHSVLWNLLSNHLPEGKLGWLWALPKGLLDCGYLQRS